MAKNNDDSKTTILVPIDFSDDSEAALLWACQRATALDGDIVALHVVHDPADAPGSYKKGKGEALQPMAEVAAKMMRRFLKATSRKLVERKGFKKRITTKIVEGLPQTRILEVRAKVGATEIVMGSQGRTGLKRLLLGSKAEQVIRASEVPVTIVKAKRKKKKKK